MDYNLSKKSYYRNTHSINNITIETGFYMFLTLFNDRYVDQAMMIIFTQNLANTETVNI